MSPPAPKRCLALLLFSVSTVLHAQPSAPPPPADASGNVQELATIVVTAQKRGQSIDQVPIAITAYTGTFLENLGISRYQDLAPLVPGLFVSTQSANFPNFNIRGVGSDTTDPRQEARISIFQDGVGISRVTGSLTELFDLERVEVLKGPQGTLFGRSAGSGAISLVSRKPSDAREAKLTLGAGTLARRHASGHVNTPLGSDKLLGRVAFSATHRDGTVDNLADGSDLNSRETVAVRPSLRWLPTDRTTVDLIFNFQRDTPAGTGFKSGVIPTSRGDTNPFLAAELNRGARLGLDRTVWGGTALVTHEISESWTLHTNTAWRAYDSQEDFDGDGSPLTMLESSEKSTGRQFSQEVRANFDARGRFTGFVGAAVFRERAEQRVNVFIDERYLWPFTSGGFRDGLLAAGLPAALVNAAVPPMAPFSPQTHLPAGFAAFAAVPPLAPLAALAGAPLKPLHSDRYFNSAEFDAADVFVDGTWRATERLEFTTGARVSFEEQTTGYDVPANAVPSTLGFVLGNAPNFAVAPSGGLLTDHDHETGWVGRFIARYILTPEINAYAGLSRGRRPGALIITSTDRLRTGEESLANREIGVKGNAFGGRLAWSAAAFYYRYSHFQTLVRDPDNISRFITVDAGRATGRGGEFSLRAIFSDTLSAFATYGYTDATFDEMGDNGEPQRYAGSTLRLTARHTAALGATFEHSAGRFGRFSLSPIFQYKSSHHFEDDNNASGGSLRQPGFALVNVRLGWRSLDQRWEAAAYVENLFDKDYLIDAGNIGGSFGIPTFIRGEPRLFGFDLTRHW